MSDDDRRDDRRRRDRDRDRSRDRDRRNKSPAYEEEEIIRARRGPKGSGGAMVPRRRDHSSSSSSAEEVPRAFPPGGGYDRRRDGDRRDVDRRDVDRRRRDRRERVDYGRTRHDDRSRYEDRSRYDDRSDYDPPRRSKRRESSSSYSSRSPPRRDRHKSLGEQALAALGIGGAAGAVASSRSKSRSRRSRRYSDSSSSRSRSRGRGKKGGDPRDKVIQAARAAVIAGGAEAWRMRKEPGGWGGPKGRRVLTAAVGAAGIDGLLDKDPNKGGVKHTIEAVVGGLAGNRLLNGSRRDDEANSRSRSQSRGRDSGGIAGLSAGAGALAASAANAFSSRTKQNGGRRDYSSSSEDSRRGGGRRNKPVSDYIKRGMGALGIGGNKDPRHHGEPMARGLNNQSPAVASPMMPAPGPVKSGPRVATYSMTPTQLNSEDEEDYSSTEEDRERKQMGHKQLITAGLASVATIHAANSIYQSMQMGKVRKKEVKDGDLSRRDARKLKSKHQLQNAATLGIAALGVKGAYSEWKEMKEQREKAHEFDLNRARRKERRLVMSQYGLSSGSTSHRGSNIVPPPGPIFHPHVYPAGGRSPSIVDDPDQYYAEQPGPRYGDVPYYAVENHAR